MTLLYRIHKIVLGGVFRLCFRIQAEGTDEIPLEGPLILAANHASFMDPIVVGLACPRQITGLAKEELWRVPILGWWLDRMEAKPIRRGQSDASALKAALEALGHGKAVLVFPEGTRSWDGTIGPMKPGVGLLARRSQAVVVPTYISGTFLALPRTRYFPRLAKIRVYFAPAIGRDLVGEVPADRRGYLQITRRVEQAIRKMHDIDQERHLNRKDCTVRSLTHKTVSKDPIE